MLRAFLPHVVPICFVPSHEGAKLLRQPYQPVEHRGLWPFGVLVPERARASLASTSISLSTLWPLCEALKEGAVHSVAGGSN